MSGKKKKSKKTESSQSIVIDESRGLVFSSEDAVVEHFKNEIDTLEKEYNLLRAETDTALDDIEDIEQHLSELLQEPDEVWLSKDIFEGTPLGTFVGYFETEDEEQSFYYVALTYFVDNTPKFVFIHFATSDLNLLKKYQRGKKIYDRNNAGVQSDEITVDALTEGDELALGLYQAMLKLRSAQDIPEKEFEQYTQFREETIEEPDEIWRKIDTEGRVLVTFIKSIEDGDIKYVVITKEDEASESQYLLFSFPSKDHNLVDRYRNGESLDATSYTREESH